MVVAAAKIFTYTTLLIASFRMYQEPTNWFFIQNVNLVFHEAGHIFLMPFGTLAHFLGGTLFEFGIPLLITGYFLYTGQRFGAAITSWWLATALLSISVYAADALHRQLPLLGGEAVRHDWNTILNMTNTLQYYEQIAGTWYGLSIAALAAGAFFLYLDLKHMKAVTRSTKV